MKGYVMLRYALVASAFLLFSPAMAQNKEATGPGYDKPIVITGVRIADLRARLEKCLARKCPPNEDVDASTALAEEQFVEGDYWSARATLRTALSRNKRFAKDYPVPVSDLWRADSRVAAHMGSGTDYRSDTFEMIDALKAGLPGDDIRVLSARIEVGDMMARFGEIDEAVGEYNRLARRARDLKLYGLEGTARLRVVLLYTTLAQSDARQFALYFGPAKKAAHDIASDPTPQMKLFAAVANLLVERVGAKKGDDNAVDRMIEIMRAQQGGVGPPALLYQPPLQGFGGLYDGSIPPVVWTKINSNDLLGQWADIGFWIRPDGTVREVEVLRGGIGALTGVRSPNRRFDPVWTLPLVKQISGRRYTPLATGAAGGDVLRVERYSFTAWLTSTSNSLVPTSGPPRYEMIDLSADPVPASARDK
jgi:hypothetical protein